MHELQLPIKQFQSLLTLDIDENTCTKTLRRSLYIYLKLREANSC